MEKLIWRMVLLFFISISINGCDYLDNKHAREAYNSICDSHHNIKQINLDEILKQNQLSMWMPGEEGSPPPIPRKHTVNSKYYDVFIAHEEDENGIFANQDAERIGIERYDPDDNKYGIKNIFLLSNKNKIIKSMRFDPKGNKL
jgi:hypothetical protein